VGGTKRSQTCLAILAGAAAIVPTCEEGSAKGGTTGGQPQPHLGDAGAPAHTRNCAKRQPGPLAPAAATPS